MQWAMMMEHLRVQQSQLKLLLVNWRESLMVEQKVSHCQLDLWKGTMKVPLNLSQSLLAMMRVLLKVYLEQCHWWPNQRETVRVPQKLWKRLWEMMMVHLMVQQYLLLQL